MPTLTFSEARDTVLRIVRESRPTPGIESVRLGEAAGRVLAGDAAADRDMPAVARSIRDGFAVRTADLPGELKVTGEAAAGQRFHGTVGPGQAVEIMTGAPVPAGADAVVMIEHTRREGERVHIAGSAAPGQFINPRASEASAGETVLAAGTRLDYSAIALLAALGRDAVPVFRSPSVAIAATGDELVDVHEIPEDFQVRNSNAHSLAVQVARAGGVPRVLPAARDNLAHTGETIERGLEADLLLLSGGVSAGRHDLVKGVLAEFGAEFFFDRVLIRPGQPLVFGRVREKFFFGLPGNPASTMVTFELFARAALELLAGQRETALRMPLARLTHEFRHGAGLTHFLPARMSPDGCEVTPLAWRGSSDIAALARANAFLVAENGRDRYAAGDLIPVLLK